MLEKIVFASKVEKYLVAILSKKSIRMTFYVRTIQKLQKRINTSRTKLSINAKKYVSWFIIIKTKPQRNHFKNIKYPKNDRHPIDSQRNFQNLRQKQQ